MICPNCKHGGTRVLDSRDTDTNRAVRRRRECESCKHRFTTFERVENNKFLVVKKDGSREAYDRDKLIKGVWTACEKRKITEEQVTQMINKLEDVWSGMGKEVPSETIGEGIMDALKELDEVAYIRFASVYRQFKDIDSFKKELQRLQEGL